MDLSRRELITAVGAAALGTAAARVEEGPAPSQTAEKKPSAPASAGPRAPGGRKVATAAIHAGNATNCSAMPIYPGTTNENGQYGREGSPTVDAMARVVQTLEGAEASLATACGMAAVSQTLLALLKSGDRVVCHRSVYIGTTGLMSEDLPRWGVEVDRVDMRDLDQLRAAVRKKTRLVYFEPYANCSLDVIDVRGAVEIAHAAGALVVVDNTWLSPVLLLPLELGADLVLHSATKYLNGHGDGLSGVVSGKADLVAQVKKMRSHLGGILSPQIAAMVIRGIQTLPLRMPRHCENAQQLADFLATHPKVREVRYAGLKSHPGHAVAARQQRGFGGMLGLALVPRHSTARFCRALRVCKPWPSLGDAKTLVMPWGKEEARGIPDRFLRVSVGLEDLQDLIADFDQALAQAGE